MMIDSLEMTDADRQLILERCAAARAAHRHHPRHRLHGAYRRRPGPAIQGKTIVLTGAMVPYSSAAPTGCSTWDGAGIRPDPGAGSLCRDERRCFPWHSVRKNREQGFSRSRNQFEI